MSGLWWDGLTSCGQLKAEADGDSGGEAEKDAEKRTFGDEGDDHQQSKSRCQAGDKTERQAETLSLVGRLTWGRRGRIGCHGVRYGRDDLTGS